MQLSVEEGSPEYQVLPDKDRMQRLGLNTAYAGQNLRIAFSGNDDASLTETGTEYPVRIWLADFDRRNYEDVSRLTILNPAGIPVQVAQFARVVEGRTPSLLERKDRQPAVTITSDALGRPSGTVADEVVTYLNENPLPDGISLAWEGDIKRQNDSFGALGSVLAISFLLIYLIMVALYDSFIYPFVALFSIPVAGIGAIFSPELIFKQFEFVCPVGADYADGAGNKKCYFNRGLHEPTQRPRFTLPAGVDTSRKRTDAPDFDDNHSHGHRDVAHCIGKGNGERVEKRIGLGHHRWADLLINSDGRSGADGVLSR